MEKIVCTMMDLIASEVCGKTVEGSKYVLSEEELATLYELSKAHDLAHLVGEALIKRNLVSKDEIRERFQKKSILAVYRYEKINYELDRLREALSQEGIPFLPLKGSVIRLYYPEPWMRTSCDIDILIREEQVDGAAQILAEKLGYAYEKKSYHDISMMSESGVHLELHHSIKENMEPMDTLLADCWSYATPCGEYEYRFGNEFFLFHQLAHAAYHFLRGGCGVRPFLDLYLLKQKLKWEPDMLDEMLSKAGIRRFSEAAMRLANVWFGDGEHDTVTAQMENFVLSGGVYGTTENSIAVSQQTQKGQIGYLLHRIWLPYELLCGIYPTLRGRRCLQPFYEVRRWFKMLDPETRKRKKRDLATIKRLDSEKKSEVNRMLNELGLM